MAGRMTATPPPPTTPVTIDRITSVPPDSAIWCTKTWCICDEGKKWNGCVHTDKLCVGGSLTCGPGAKVCSCKAA